MDGDVKVGEVWRFDNKVGFGFKLYGYYWRGSCPNKDGGSPITKIRKLSDAPILAEQVLSYYREK